MWSRSVCADNIVILNAQKNINPEWAAFKAQHNRARNRQRLTEIDEQQVRERKRY